MTKKILFFLLLSVLVVSLPVLASAEEETDPSNPYGIYVGGVAVTEANQSNILGDGTAFYTPQNDTLTLRNYKNEKFYELSSICFSVYCSKSTNIIIEGKENTFIQGVYTEKGNITLKNTNVTFGKSSFFGMTATSGTLKIEQSNLVLGDLHFVPSEGYYIRAKEVLIDKSSVILETTQPTKTYAASMIYASSDLSATHSEFRFSVPYPVVGAMFLGGNLVFENCDIYISRGNYAFHTQWGILQFADCNVEVSETRSFSSSPDFVAIDTTVKATLFYQGIHAVGSTEGEGFISISSNLDIEMLPYEAISDTIMKGIWDNMDAAERVEYGQSYDAYLTNFKNTTYKTATEGNAGIAVTGGGCYLNKTKMNIRGFDFGMLGLYGVPIEIGKRCDLSLDAEEAAFLWFAFSYEGVLIGGHRLSGTDLTYTTVPASLEKAGEIAVCSANTRLSFKGSGEIESTADLLDRIEGMEDSIRIRTAPYTASIVLVTVLVVALCGGFVVAAVLIFVPNFRMAKAERNSKKKKNNFLLVK